ncbi:MAG TPA: hypothetical protein VH115_05925 [Solirubrobacteraceae bacterium]|nr:hypothetical protein [Solirubrobacteraceae bacterium]
MAPLRRIADRLTYANTVATIALFIALGGASYAAIEVPANSVGPRQLRARAVGTRALGFPLGVTGVTDEHREDLTKSVCDAPAPPGVGSLISCPVILLSGVRAPGREVAIRLPARGRVLMSAVVGLRSAGPAGANATVSMRFIVDGTRVGSDEPVVIAGGEHLQVPAQLLVRAERGSHTVGLLVSAQYAYFGPGDVFVSPVSLVVTALPPA